MARRPFRIPQKFNGTKTFGTAHSLQPPEIDLSAVGIALRN
jgi:hypothetical protein